MQSDLLIRRTATTASLVLAVVVLGTTAAIAWPRLAGAIGSAPAAPAPAYAVGTTVDVPAAWYAGAPRTLVLVAQASCGACQQAAPYLRELLARLDGRAAVVMATPGLMPEYDFEYAESIGLDANAVRVMPKGTRARVTPTLVVVNQRGEVLGSWEGVGPEAQHVALTRAIEAAIEGGR